MSKGKNGLFYDFCLSQEHLGQSEKSGKIKG
jgi:hypothetical protein